MKLTVIARYRASMREDSEPALTDLPVIGAIQRIQLAWRQDLIFIFDDP
jgi:hypothetical protein